MQSHQDQKEYQHQQVNLINVNVIIKKLLATHHHYNHQNQQQKSRIIRLIFMIDTSYRHALKKNNS